MTAADGKTPDGPAPEGGGKRERKAFLLRLSPELMAELRAWAGAEFRSINAHVEYLLREAVRRRQGGDGADEQA